MQEFRDDDPDIALLRVLRDDASADPASDPLLSPDVLLRGYREMRRLRLLDDRMISLQRQGRIGFYGGARGQEAVPIAIALALREEDWVFPALREQSLMLVRGFPLRTFIAQVLGNSGRVINRGAPCIRSAGLRASGRNYLKRWAPPGRCAYAARVQSPLRSVAMAPRANPTFMRR